MAFKKIHIVKITSKSPSKCQESEEIANLMPNYIFTVAMPSS